MLNEVRLIGTLGRDPELKFFDTGNALVKLNVATENRYKDKRSGEWTKATEWHKVVQFGTQAANNHSKYLAKGSKVYVEGRIQTDKWEDNEGVTRYTTQIIASKVLYLSPSPAQAAYDDAPQPEKPGFEPQQMISEDDVPF